MKFKTTQKSIKENYGQIIKVGYCRLQFMLSAENPVAYTSGADGWNADIYDIDGIAIVTGYAPFGHYKADYETTQKYEQRAQEIKEATYSDYAEQKKQLRGLIKEFIAEITE